MLMTFKSAIKLPEVSFGNFINLIDILNRSKNVSKGNGIGEFLA